VSRAERRWCLAFGGLLAIVTTLPYVWAVAREGEAWRFSGFLFGVEDGNSYVAKMLAGSYGAWLFRTPYTTVPQTGILAFLPYLVLGKLAAGPALHEQLLALYHGARVAAIPFGVMVTYGFASRFLQEPRARQWATVLASIGGGLGWLIPLSGRSTLYGSLPLEFYSPETFGFLAVLGLPHLVVARALLLVALGWYLDGVQQSGRTAWAAVALLALGLFQPLAVVSAWVVIVFHVMLEAWRGGLARAALLARLRVAAGVIAGSSPVVVYYGVLGIVDPFVREWTAQNIIRSPHPIHYVLAYGLFVVVAVWGVARARPRGPHLLLIGWLLALPALAYAPVELQRRLPDGVWVAIVILAVAAVCQWSGGPGSPAIISFAAVSLPSTLLLIVGSLRTAMTPSTPAFIAAEAVAAYRTLSDRAQPGDAVLASFPTGNVLPAWAPVRVPMGHGPESIRLVDVRPRVEAFFRAETDEAERQALLAEHEVRFVFSGPSERSLGDWNPDTADYLTGIYSSGGFQIFAVNDLPGCDCGSGRGG
jgi:hypothetical protein